MNDLENDENNNLNQKFDTFINNANHTIKKGIQTTQNTFENIKEKGTKTIKNIDNTLRTTFNLPTMENKLERIKSSKRDTKMDEKLDEKLDDNKIKKVEKESLDSMYKGNMFSKIIGVLIISVLLIALIYAGSEYYKYTYLNIMDSDKVVILEGIHEGSIPKLISQDPKYKSSVAINKSDNRAGGMEFTYSFWIMINGTKKKRQHIFHKGDKYQINKTPGVFLEPNKNVMKFYFNISKPKDEESLTSDSNTNIQKSVPKSLDENNYETVEIENLPLKKWINITFTFIENKKETDNNFNILSIYINGLLKKSKYLSSLPVLNNHDLHLTRHGGFNGHLAKMYYYPKRIDKEEIFKLVDDCPKNIGCGIDADCPPYLDNNWWFN